MAFVTQDTETVIDIMRQHGIQLPDNIRRIVIDVQVDSAVIVYYETEADKSLLDAVFSVPDLKVIHVNNNSTQAESQ